MDEVVWSGEFVADERLGFEKLSEAPGVSEPPALGKHPSTIYRGMEDYERASAIRSSEGTENAAGGPFMTTLRG
jgi:hypothetical protein